MIYDTNSYDYNLPENLIASSPLERREDAKLLVYNRSTKTIIDDYFYNIEKYIPKNTAIILNNTKVIKARVFGAKVSGGKIELLFIKDLGEKSYLVNIRGKVKVGTKIHFPDSVVATIEKLNSDGSRVVSFSFEDSPLDFQKVLEFLEKNGHIPLPPYMRREDNEEDSTNYQTVFAKHEGSVAAPTASLHFSEDLLSSIKKNHQIEEVTLHVGAGTFKSVDVTDIREHQMHSENYIVPKEAKDLILSEKKILSVGTTSTRTVEYFHRTQKECGECDLFLNLGNPPQRVDFLVTNFHLPKSTLIMLVASFIGLDEVKKVYQHAIENRYRFFSYGDGMFII